MRNRSLWAQKSAPLAIVEKDHFPFPPTQKLALIKGFSICIFTIIPETVAHLCLIMLSKNTSNYIMTERNRILSKSRGKWSFLLYVPNLYVIIICERTFLVCLITAFCLCMKSRGFIFLFLFFLFEDLFCSAYSWLVRETEAAFMTCLPDLPQTRTSGSSWENMVSLSYPFLPFAGNSKICQHTPL